MLDLWRPPTGAGDAIGCLATTYTFTPSLFDEQCLARFLEVESEPNREELAFLLERESRLGGTYAGVMVDHTQAGVEHSLRWDIMPVRIAAGKQHAKLSLLAWRNHVRVIIASANLTDPGYRSNQEVAMALDATPGHAIAEYVSDAITFLRSLLAFVPGANRSVPEIDRALGFLNQVERQVADWTGARRHKALRQRLVFTLPSLRDNPLPNGKSIPARSSLEEAVGSCRQYGASPSEAWVASPFYDFDSEADEVTATLCKLMARGSSRDLCFCVPAVGDADEHPIRLAAPASLMHTPGRYSAQVEFEILPQKDSDKNARPWHAKMLALQSNTYSALMMGSSNFTKAGMGLGHRRNAEANILTIAERRAHAREPGLLEAIWPAMERIADPHAAQWLGPSLEGDEEQRAEGVPLPSGFVSVTYRAGNDRRLIMNFDPDHLPDEWSVLSCGQQQELVLDSDQWIERNRADTLEVNWEPVQPPVKLLVRWSGGEAFWALNVEDAKQLPPPAALEKMSADDMLLILAASDPSAAFRAWAKSQQAEQPFDDELDAATPADLDPLRRYDLRVTFLHRIRSRARVLAQLRQNLQRPMWGTQALQWRLEGFIGIKPLAERLVRDIAQADGKADEAVLVLADFLIVLHEVEYEPVDGSLTKSTFNKMYRPFLSGLVGMLNEEVRPARSLIAPDVLAFWDRVVQRCQI